MSATVLIVDDEENARRFISSFLTSKGYEVHTVATLAEARQHIRQGSADIILLDVRLPDGYGPVLLEETAHLPLRPPIILITAYGEIDMAVEAMKNGAHDFLQKPIQFPELEVSVQRAANYVAMQRELNHLRQAQQKPLDNVVARSQAMQELLELAHRAATASISVLITGETGTGKEVLARAIHCMGPRVSKPFIDINCPAIQSTMLEAELFGHEAGAFTSADKRKPGLMEIADEGVLFLDEISSLQIDMQAKLLRALDEHAFYRVGGINKLRVDVQVIAASNRDLPTMMKNGDFREDLYYRLDVLGLKIPPLRERKEDIPELVGLFIRQNNPRLGLNVAGVSHRAMQAIMDHDWPGNIRELRNVTERAMILCDDSTIDLAHLPREIAQPKS